MAENPFFHFQNIDIFKGEFKRFIKASKVVVIVHIISIFIDLLGSYQTQKLSFWGEPLYSSIKKNDLAYKMIRKTEFCFNLEVDKNSYILKVDLSIPTYSTVKHHQRTNLV